MSTTTARRGRGLGAVTLERIKASKEILARIQPASVRAVCYQLFVAGVLPDMSKNSTNAISRALVTAREMEMIPWEWIVDEAREAERVPSWADPDAYARTVARSYRRDRWQDQSRQVEVWSEKGTIRGTLRPVLEEYGVTFRVMHGYGSATVLYDVAEDTRDLDVPLLVLYAGDWDPSGLHMSQVDIPQRLREYGGRVDLRRVALTSADIGDSLPSFPAKRTDSRYRWFVDRYGRLAWEIDALDPVILRERVAAAIAAVIDWDAWERCDVAEQAELGSLHEVLREWRRLSA